MDLKNKIALLTGGAVGIGFACSEELLRNEVKHLAILDLATSVGAESVKKLNAEFGEGRVIFIACDVTNAKEFEAGFAKTVEKFGGLDIVVNNAGTLNGRQWELMITLNYTAVVRGTLLSLQYMRKDKGGKGGVIVNVASIYGLDPGAFLPIYAGTKHAVVALSRSLGLPYHYDKTGVRVLTICPGNTDTPLASVFGTNLLDFIDAKDSVGEIDELPIQGADNVAKGMVHIIQSAKSGTVWVSEGAEPAYEVLITDRKSRKAPVKD